MPGPDPRALRNVLSRYATGIAVITTRDEAGDHVAVTVNSFVSVSLDPPLVLFSLARRANVLGAFNAADHFAVNILGTAQQAISNMFAAPSTARWADAQFTCGESGCALLRDSLAHIECCKWAQNDGGDHVIFLGEVTRFHLCAPDDPLLFFRGGYGSFSRDSWNKSPPSDSLLADFIVPGWG